MNNTFELSALVVCYEPNLKKLIMTLKSLIYQKDVCLQIVIADDGSEIDHFDDIKKFFEDNNFNDFVLVKNPKNVGTVKNSLTGVNKCKGTYVKGISPGDYLADENSLRTWLDYIKSHNLQVCGADYYCYHFNDEGKIEYTKNSLTPSIAGLSGYKLRFNYLINNDIFLGAAVICDKDLFYKYLKIIENKVKYTEDNVYRMMAYSGENLGFFNQRTVIYEVGTGISTCNNAKWAKIIKQDFIETDELILTLPSKDKKLQKIYHKFCKLNLNWKNLERNKYRFFYYLLINGLVLLKIRKRINSRISSCKLPTAWLKKIGGEVTKSS